MLFVIFSLPVILAVSLLALAPAPQAKVLLVGDMLFDRYIRQVAERQGGEYVFSCIKEFLQSADLVVGNLEGPITGRLSVSMGSEIGMPQNFQFTFPPETAKLLAAHNVRVVNIGNNHSGNFGAEGISSTKQYLELAGVAYIGMGAIHRTEVNNVPISFINYNEFGGESAKKVAQIISAEHAGGRVVVVYAHWGEEYQPVLERTKRLARSFVDAGAVIVVGSHPHIVQEHEVYKGRDIYYSLGNFIFDQYWNEEVSRGLALLLTITEDSVAVEEHAVETRRDGRTCLLVE